MAVEIPRDEITQIQSSLRKAFGFVSYNREDDFRSLGGVISELDPWPEYLRCNHCKGRILRGVKSFICVFCGEEPNNDVSPYPLQFFSTMGCRWFLDYLHLDGSELVEGLAEASELSRGLNARKTEFPLFDLLDFEIRWPSETERCRVSVSDETLEHKLSTLNFDGVDIDKFVGDGEEESVNQSSAELLKPNEDIGAENIQFSEAVVSLKKDEISTLSSAWNAEFNWTASGTQDKETSSVDAFLGSLSDNVFVHVDSFSEPRKDVFDGRSKDK